VSTSKRSSSKDCSSTRTAFIAPHCDGRHGVHHNAVDRRHGRWRRDPCVCSESNCANLHARLGKRIKVEPKINLGQWLGVALSFVWISLAKVVLVQADIIMVGIFLSSRDVAIYSAAAATSGLVNFPLYAVNALSAPKFAALYAQQRRLELQALVTNVVRWTFWPSLAIALIFVACGSLILRLFGPGFEQGYAVLLILTLGQVVNAFAGTVLSLLNVTGHQGLTARVLSTSAIFGVVFGLVFTQIWGSVGTAVAFSGAMVLWNVWLAIFVIRKLGIYPSLVVLATLPGRLPPKR